MNIKHFRGGKGSLDFATVIFLIFVLLLIIISIYIPLRGRKVGRTENKISRIQEGSSAANVCGNHICEEGETCSNCPDDCGYCSSDCGNCICERGETCSNCPIDCCGCGDGACNRLCGEDSLNCPQDCR